MLDLFLRAGHVRGGYAGCATGTSSETVIELVEHGADAGRMAVAVDFNI